MDRFKLVSEYKPTGDQPQAIDALVKGVMRGLQVPARPLPWRISLKR